MNTILHKADARGHATHGWLESFHSFSFASFYDEEKIHFGALRVLNDDSVAPGMGFGKHPHDNMEIISIPLEGDLEHGDSLGNKTVIRQGDVQAMSAGTGVVHSEKNHNSDKPVKFLQIWIIPNKVNVQPRYDQKTISESDMENKLATIVSPVGSNDGGVEIHQDAWFNMGRLEKRKKISYSARKGGNGVYAFVLEGMVTLNGTLLGDRDALGVEDAGAIEIVAESDARILLIDVPMI